METPEPDSSESNQFGAHIKKLRERKGYVRKEVVARLEGYYSDEGSYGRIEQGGRSPKRDSVLAILIKGLLLTDPSEINAYLALSGFDGLTDEEARRFQLGSTGVKVPAPPVPKPVVKPPSNWERIADQQRPWAAASALVASSLLLGGLILSYGTIPSSFSLATVILYAALYSVSILLEAACAPIAPKHIAASVVVFSFLVVSSATAIFVGAALEQTGSSYGMVVSLAFLVISAIAQGVLVRDVLPDFSVVKARFHTHTGQAAHWKNTGYFLLLFLVYWMPSLHCVSALRKFSMTGQSERIPSALSHLIIAVPGVLCLNVELLWGLTFLLLLLSIPMRSRILDNLEPSPNVNRYESLFYLRASLYFSLVFLCAGWFTVSVRAFVP